MVIRDRLWSFVWWLSWLTKNWKILVAWSQSGLLSQANMRPPCWYSCASPAVQEAASLSWMEGKDGRGGETVQSLVLAWSCIRALRLKSFGTFHILSPARQQRRKPDSSWQHFTKPTVLTSGRTWPMAVLTFPYLFRNEFFVPCLTGLQLCKGWNPSKGSNETKGELLNTKAEAER